MSLGKLLKTAWNYNPIVMGAKAIGNVASGNLPTIFNSSGDIGSGSYGLTDLATSLGELNAAYNQPTAQLQYEMDMKRMNAQHDLARSDYDYQLEMESPAMQLQRAKDAGLNPTMFAGSVGGADASIASPQISSGNDFNKSFFGDAQNIMSIFGAISDLTKTFQDMQLGAEEIAGKKLENQFSAITNKFAEVKNLRELANLSAEFEGRTWDNKLKGLDYNLFNDTYNYRRDQFKYDTEAAALEVQNRDLQNQKLFEDLREFLMTRNVRIESLNLQNDKDRAVLQEYADKHKMSPLQIENLVLSNIKMEKDMHVIDEQYRKLLHDNDYFWEHNKYPGTYNPTPWSMLDNVTNNLNNSFTPISVYKDLVRSLQNLLKEQYENMKEDIHSVTK